jgi:hypothetical protein
MVRGARACTQAKATIGGVNVDPSTAKSRARDPFAAWNQIKMQMLRPELLLMARAAASVSARIMLPSGPNIYQYAKQTPLSEIDPSGLVVGGFTPRPTSNIQQCGEVIPICFLQHEQASRKFDFRTCNYLCFGGSEPSVTGSLLTNVSA